MKLLLLSNSANAGEGYLDYAESTIRSFIGKTNPDILFIPYAAISISFDAYASRVKARFARMGLGLRSIHVAENPEKEIEKAGLIVIGGGNTFNLLNLLQVNSLVQAIRKKVKQQGTPLIGWSAGSNVACPTICTTNDMPVVEPESFTALNLIPFQINPHFLDVHPEGLAGETREQRILEYLEINPDRYVVGLRESTMLWIEDQQIRLIGNRTARVFHAGMNPLELGSENDLQFLLQ